MIIIIIIIIIIISSSIINIIIIINKMYAGMFHPLDWQPAHAVPGDLHPSETCSMCRQEPRRCHGDLGPSRTETGGEEAAPGRFFYSFSFHFHSFSTFFYQVSFDFPSFSF